MKEQDTKITYSEEYKMYLAALCRLASHYVSRIRVQYAERAYEKYQDEPIRRLVLEYGMEIEKLERDRLRDFRHCSEFGAVTTGSLEDSCLNRAKSYGDAIHLLFNID